MSSTIRSFHILGLSSQANFSEVKGAYKKLVKVWHPDLYATRRPSLISRAQERFKEINLAYYYLCEQFKEASLEDSLNGFKERDNSAYYSEKTNDRDTNKNEQSEKSSFELANGDRYFGEIRNGEMHGVGTYYFACGDLYHGYFVNGSREGIGIYTHSNGCQYQGEFLDGKPNGRGEYNYSNGDRYEGEFVEEEMSGSGTYYYANGDRFIGSYKDGSPHGSGKYVTSPGNSFEGYWVNGDLI
jgi:hypothetical protein